MLNNDRAFGVFSNMCDQERVVCIKNANFVPKSAKM